MPVMNMFPGGSTLKIPLDAPTALAAKAGNAKVELTWTDPKDKYATPEGEQAQDPQQLVSVWAYTKIVRKAGSAPAGPNDGVAVVSSQVRNAYQAQPFVDTGVVNDTTYYYAAFAYNEDFVVSEGDFSEGVTPKAYDPVLANNTWEQIDAVCTEGIAPSVWEIGDEHDLEVLSETVTAAIADFNHDDLADGSGKKAVITFSLKNVPGTTYMFNNNNSSRNVNFYSSPQWAWYQSTLIPSISSDLASVMRAVSKTACSFGGRNWGNPPTIVTNQTGNVLAFPFSCNEVSMNPGKYGDLTATEGSPYPYFSTAANRVKHISNDAGEAAIWNLRTCEEYDQGTSGGLYITQVFFIGTLGTLGSQQFLSNLVYNICFGFCVGKAAA